MKKYTPDYIRATVIDIRQKYDKPNEFRSIEDIAQNDHGESYHELLKQARDIGIRIEETIEA